MERDANPPEPDWESPVGLMTILAESFPSLREAMNGRPFDPQWMEAHVEESADAGSRASAKFVLDVWNAHQPTRQARFDLIEAMRVWDNDHRNAFDEWVNGPVYPEPEPGVPIHLRKQPRRWTASEAINTLWDYLDSFEQAPNDAAVDRLSALEEELEWLEEQEIRGPVDA
jgi:hypothetical protein